MVVDEQGGMFYYHEKMECSQWEMPEELEDVLGKWDYIQEEGFWRNDTVNLSLWNDPLDTTNVFKQSLEGNIFFLQLYIHFSQYTQGLM